MSAAEKLRALDGKFELLRVGKVPPPVVELMFWPQIVAVVEAAETCAPILHNALGQTGMNMTPSHMLYAALAALDEALQ